jgi:hypothetical protein
MYRDVKVLMFGNDAAVGVGRVPTLAKSPIRLDLRLHNSILRLVGEGFFRSKI